MIKIKKIWVYVTTSTHISNALHEYYGINSIHDYLPQDATTILSIILENGYVNGARNWTCVTSWESYNDDGNGVYQIRACSDINNQFIVPITIVYL